MTALYGLSGKRLPVHPQPLPDELLTHWFMRLAHANHLKSQTLADWAFGKPSSFWARDQDKLASPTVISSLADLTGQASETLHGLTLAAYEGILYRHHNPMGNTRWILPMGVYHRKRRNYGLQYCPLCLATDPVPYFRRQWRLAFATICDRHGTLMHDRCHKCGVPVAFHRGELGHWDKHQFDHAALCHSCGADLSRAPAWDAPAGAVEPLIALRSLVAFHFLGWTFSEKETFQYSHLYLDVVRHLCTFFLSRHGVSLWRLVEKESRLPPMTLPAGRNELEFLSLRERHHLLLGAIWLLQEWPDGFVWACREARVVPSRLLAYWDPPYWFEQVVAEHLSLKQYQPTDEEARNAAEHLARQGEAITMAAVGKLIGSKDITAALPYRVKRRPPQTDEEVRLFFRALGRLLGTLRWQRRRFLIWQRNKALFLAAHCFSLSLDNARQLTTDELVAATMKYCGAWYQERLVAPPRPPRVRYPCTRPQIQKWFWWYISEVRPAMVGDRESDVAFPTEGIGCLSSSSVQAIVAKVRISLRARLS